MRLPSARRSNCVTPLRGRAARAVAKSTVAKSTVAKPTVAKSHAAIVPVDNRDVEPARSEPHFESTNRAPRCVPYAGA